MKKLKLVLITFLVYTMSTSALQSQPLAVENASWLLHTRWPEMFGSGWGHSFFGYVLNGDSTINEKTYKKVYKFDVAETFRNTTFILNPLPVLHSFSRSLFGFVRDENQKVYAIKTEDLFNCPSNSEYVLFDYSYQVGDTVKLCIANYPWYPPCIIDSIRQNTLPFNRKTFYCTSQRILYQGIGSNYGLFESLLYQIADIDLALENFSTNGLFGLGVITGIKELNGGELQFDLYPNPAQDFIKVKVSGSNNFSDLSVIIFNQHGKKVLQQNLHLDNFEINISKLQQGVYIAKIKLGDGSFVRKKFVVIK